jgi:peptidoglycan hydrolase CwlO-like protein
MKNDVAAEAQEQFRDTGNRINPLDEKLAELEARVERNRAALERTNQKIQAKITQLEKRVELGK